MTDAENWLAQMRRGTLELAILNVLAREPRHGYGLARRLAGGPGLAIGEGTVYPILNRLRENRLISSRLVASTEGPARRVYSLTAAGERQRRDMNERWAALAGSLDRVIREAAGARPGDER